MNSNIDKFLIPADSSIIQAMKYLDITAEKILFIIDNNKILIGSLTDGDIRRWILSGGSLEENVEKVCNKNSHIVYENYSIEEIKKVMLDTKIECVPVINERKEVIELFFWSEVFGDKIHRKPGESINLPVVIMAGGKGTRLDPFTKILPKPLIPIGEKPIIEIIIEKFTEYSVNNFYISVNYKAKIIKSYFEELNPEYTVQYIHEDKPLGTAGSLKYLEGKISGSFIVTNCDIIIEANYNELVTFHSERKNDITMVASVKNYNIPYGVCEIENGGNLLRINEKPKFNFLVNTGMYILNEKVLKLIPPDTYFQMTDLIESVKNHNGTVGVFPVSDKAWIDIGEWEEYKNALQHLNK